MLLAAAALALPQNVVNKIVSLGHDLDSVIDSVLQPLGGASDNERERVSQADRSNLATVVNKYLGTEFDGDTELSTILEQAYGPLAIGKEDSTSMGVSSCLILYSGYWPTSSTTVCFELPAARISSTIAVRNADSSNCAAGETLRVRTWRQRLASIGLPSRA